MEKIDYIIKCRILYLYSIAVMNGQEIALDEQFNTLLDNFMSDNFVAYFPLFNLIYQIDVDDDGDINICEEEYYDDMLYYCFKELNKNPNEFLKKLYSEIKYSDVEKISRLAELFYQYVIGVISGNILLLKRQ